MAIDCVWRTDVGTQKLKHRRCNTNANTDAATQMRTAATQIQTQTLKHNAENRAGTKKLTQMVKVVIDDNRLVMEHTQVLEHRS